MVTDNATVDVCGMCIYAFVSRNFCVRNARIGTLWKYALIHIGVGLCVARSTIPGNARASVCGTSNGSTPTLFYAAKPINLTPTAFSGAKGIKVSYLCSSIVIKFTVHQYPCSKISGLGRRKTLKREEQ